MPLHRSVIPLHHRERSRSAGPEWVGGLLSLPALVGGDPHRSRPDLILWIELPHNAVVGYETVELGDPPDRIAAVLEEAIERPIVGPPRRPERVRLADAAEAAEVRAAFGNTLEVVVAPTPELDAVLTAFVEYFANSPLSAGPPREPGRNDPCPCGSGRKYKKCHYEADQAARRPPEDTASPVHHLDSRLVDRLTRYAKERFGARWLRAGDAFADPDRAVQLFRPWSVYHFPVDGRSAADWLLADPGQSLRAEERAWLDSQRGAWLSVWEVQEVTPGTGLTLEDLLTGQTRSVVEALGSRQLVPGDALLGRVVDHAGIVVLGGVHPQMLPPLETAEVVSSVRRRLRRKAKVPVERLRNEAAERYLISRWEMEIALMVDRASRQPELRNTDGDEWLFTVDHFRVDSGRRAELESRLATIEDLEAPEPGDQDDAWTFVRPRDKTILGSLRLDKAGLRLETNSIARADRLRARLEAACGGLLSHRAREHSSPFAPPGPARSPGKIPTRDKIPEEEANRIVREMLDRHYADWPDHPLPALGGQTPRQAVRSPEGRERVRVLIKSFEHHAARGPAGQAPDTARLRRELGVER